MRSLDNLPNTPSVLCVHEDPNLCALMQRVLSGAGYAVDTAGNADQFRILVGRNHYQVVLVDHDLPDETGLDIIERYARTDAEPAFVMLSAREETSLAVAAMRAGALDYLSRNDHEQFVEMLPVVLSNVVERISIRSKERLLQAEIQDADRKLSAALRASPVPTMLIDSAGTLHQVNGAWRESLGTDSAQGFSLESLLHRTFVDPEAVKSAIDQASSSPVEQTVQVRSTRGSPRTWRLHVAPLPVRNTDSALPLMLVCHGLDITDSIELEKQLRTLSLQDALTDLPNRRSLQEHLPAELARAKRDGSLVSVAMVDIDHFKAFNDLYGHLEGDHCLIRVAETLRNTLKRPADYVARFGGEEFSILLPGADANGAIAILERVRQEVEALAIPHQKSRNSPYVTISIGLACSQDTDASNAEEILKAADLALFAAKDRGRNRVERHPVSKLH